MLANTHPYFVISLFEIGCDGEHRPIFCNYWIGSLYRHFSEQADPMLIYIFANIGIQSDIGIGTSLVCIPALTLELLNY